MKKIALVFSFNESTWVSCQKIVLNLHKAYEGCQDTEIKNFNLPHESLSNFKPDQLAMEINDFNPDIISIIDHKPHPLEVLTHLSKIYSNKKAPQLFIHLFGDFSLYFQQWLKLEKILTQFPTKFFVASDRQKTFIDHFLKNQNSIVCPFPVNGQEFYFDNQVRQKQRKAWGLNEQDKVFIFTGRLSRQKRIKSLIRAFSETFQNVPEAKLYIYGHQDNLGDPFLTIYDYPGEYFRVFYKLYKSLSLELQERIVFKKQVSNIELQSVYQGADCLLNLSVHNDEDFGMSVAEAQSTGLQTIMSSWGGLRSFSYESDPSFSLFCRTKIGESSKLINIKDFKTHLQTVFSSSHHNEALRKKRSALSQQKFSIRSVTKILTESMEKPEQDFNGFTDTLIQCSSKQQMRNLEPMFISPNRKINKLYKKIYSSYADETI